MLLVVIAILVLGTGYAVVIAPADQKAIVGAAVVVLTGAGYGIGTAITTAGTDQRTYYPIAAAIGGTMIAFAWISRKQKSWPQKKKSDGKS